MNLLIQKSFLTLIINSCFFILIMVGTQNSSNKVRVDLLIEKTVKLPTGFIVGTSFIAGSILGSFLNINLDEKN